MKEYAKFYAHDKWGTCGLYASMLEALAEVGGEERVLNRVMFLLRAQRLAVDG